MRWYLLFAFLLLASSVFGSPASLTYQGRILKADGSPLEYSNVAFIFQITNPSGLCVIYQEQVTAINMSGSKGIFDVPIGKGTVSWPSGGGVSVLDAFNNSTASYACGACSGYSCTAGSSSYAPLAGDGRVLKVQFYDGNGWKAISPDTVIRSVPFAGYSLSAQKLGTHDAAAFVLKNEVNGNTSCGGGQFLTWDAATKNFGCATPSGGSGGGGTVTDVTVASPLSVTNGTSTPHITIQAASGSQNGYLTSTDWTTFNNKLGSTTNFAGDVSGTASNISVDKLKSVALAVSSLNNGDVLKYSGGNWVNGAVAVSDIPGLSTSLNGKPDYSQFPTTCTAAQTMTFISPVGGFTCTTISVNSLQGVPLDAAAPATSQVLQYDGAKWISSDLPNTMAPSGSAGGDLSGTYPNPTLSSIVTAGTGTKITYDAKGRVTSSSSLAASDIPSLDWAKITSGKPTTLSGYGITDSLVINGGGVGKMTAGTEGNFPASNTTGDLFVATDSQKIYRYNGSSWDLISSAGGSGGTITGLTGDVTASGSGSVVATISNNAVTTAKLASDAVTSAKILDGTIVSADMDFTGANAVTSGFVMKDAAGKFSNFSCVTAGHVPVWTASGFDCQAPSITETDPKIGANTLNMLSKWDGSQLVASSVYESGGNVGIGNTNPTEKLEVDGNIKATQVCIGADCRSAWPGSGGGGTVTSITAGTGLSGGTITGTGTVSIANGGVDTTQLADNAVTTVKIADGNVTGNKLETLAGLTANTYGSATQIPSITVDVKGRITAISTNTITGLPTATGASGKFLRSDGTAWSGKNIEFSDIKNSVGGSAFSLAGCGSNKTVSWSALTDTFSCQDIDNLDAAKITGGTLNAARLPTSITNALWTESSGNVYRSSGNVGIGATSPSGKLSIMKNDYNPASLNMGIYNSVDQNTAISGALNNTYGINSNISVYSPGATIAGVTGIANSLDFSGGTVTDFIGEDIYMSHSGGTLTNTYGVKVQMDKYSGTATSRYGVYLGAPYGTATNDYGFYQAGTQKNSFGGNVGIGTTNPGALLHTYGNNAVMFDRPGGNATAGSHLLLRASGGTVATPTKVLSGAMLGTVNFSGYDGSAWGVNLTSAVQGLAAEDWTTTAHGSTLAFYTTPSGANVGLERMRIAANGNTGVGTANPTDKLQIDANSANSSGLGGIKVNGVGLSYSSIMFDTDQTGTSKSVAIHYGDHTGTNPNELRFGRYGNNFGAWEANPYTFSMDAPSGSFYASPAGNIGIGTTSPSWRLTNSSAANFTAQSSGGLAGTQSFVWEHTSSNATTGYTAAIVNSLNAASGHGLLVKTTDATSSTVALAVNSGGTDRLLVRSDGNVGIGTTNPSYTLHVVGTAGLSTGTAWTNASDIRLKDIHGDYTRGLDEVLKLHTVLYNYKKDNALGLPSDFTKSGFIAQEVQKVIPEAVNKREDGYLELNVDPIHWAVVNAIKDLYHRWFQDSEKLHRDIATVKDAEADLGRQLKEKDLRILKLENENAAKAKDLEEMKRRLERLERRMNEQP